MVIVSKIQNIKKWVNAHFFSFRDNLCKLSELFPVIALAGTVIIFIHFVYWMFKGKPESEFEQLHIYCTQRLLKHYMDASLLPIVIMFGYSKNYSKFTWLCWFTLLGLWALNFIYMLFQFQTDLYYAIYSLIIYAIFVVSSIAILTNR